MKKTLLVFCLVLFASKLFAQQYSQYNTGTLYDSFENPSQRSFIPDSSRQFASNFFFPNIDGSFSLTGNAQQTLKNRYYNGYYVNKLLQVGNGSHFNYLDANANAYILMFKAFGSLSGNTELGFFAQTKLEGKGAITDESVALFNGEGAFANAAYTDIFNSNYHDQLYNVYGVTYREQVTKQVAMGFKFGYVSGINTTDVNIDHSNIVFDEERSSADLSLQGSDRKTSSYNLNPLHNPGLSLTIGASYKTADALLFQANIKDLGFIHWQQDAEIFAFNGSQTIDDLSSAQRENNVANAYRQILFSGKRERDFNTVLDSRAELSLAKLFWIDDEHTLKYTPTVIASKELFYDGFTGVLVNPVQYKNYVATLTTSYDDMQLFKIGGQLMIKSPNAEFFIGSDRIQTGRILLASLKSQNQINEYGSFTGAAITIGFSMKFGYVIEHPMNASVIPLGEEKGFLGRLWDRIFNPNAGLIKNN